MESIKLTESELRELVLEEFDKMVEDGEIDEGALGRALTRAKGAVGGQMARLGTDAKKWAKKGGQAFASALGADQTAAELGGHASDLEAQATQKQLVAKAKAALKPLGAAYSDFAQTAQARGILELPAMQQAARGLQGAIATINQAIEAAPAQQQQQPEQAPEATGDEPEPGQPGSTQAAMLNQMDATDDQLAAQGSGDAQQRVAQRQAQEQDWIARGRPSRAGVPQYRTIDQIEAGEEEQDV